MNTIEATLGQVLLVLIGLAIVLLIVILLLMEAHYIVRLSRKLVRRLRSIDPDPVGFASGPVKSGDTEVPHDEQEVR